VTGNSKENKNRDEIKEFHSPKIVNLMISIEYPIPGFNVPENTSPCLFPESGSAAISSNE
jgi:hypothetical protein